MDLGVGPLGRKVDHFQPSVENCDNLLWGREEVGISTKNRFPTLPGKLGDPMYVCRTLLSGLSDGA